MNTNKDRVTELVLSALWTGPKTMASLVKCMPPGYRDYGSMTVVRDRLQKQGKIEIHELKLHDHGRGRMVLVLKEWRESAEKRASVVA